MKTIRVVLRTVVPSVLSLATLAFVASDARAQSATHSGEALVASSVKPQDQRKADRACDEGRKALAAGKVDAASAAFERALASWPDMADARVGLGHVAMRRRDYEGALRHYQGARDAYVRGSHAAVDAATRRWLEAQRAIEYRREELNYLQEDRAPAISHVWIAVRTQQLNAEIAQLDRIQRPSTGAVRTVPADLDFFTGNALFGLGRVDEAISAWESSTRADAKHGLAFNNLAAAYFKQGRVDAARAALASAKALGIQPAPGLEQQLAR